MVAGEWLLLAGVLTVFGGQLAFQLGDLRKTTEAAERARLEHQARTVEKMLGTRFQATVNALDAIRKEGPAMLVQPGGSDRLDDQLRMMVSAMAGVRTFLLVDRDGVCVASSRPELLGTKWKDGERYRTISARPEADRLYMSPPFLTPLGNWALSLGRAILDSRGGFDGYVLAIIDPEYWNLLLESTRYAADMSVAMIHSGGKMVYRVPDPRGAVGTDLSSAPDSAFMRHVRSGLESTTHEVPLSSSGVESFVVTQSIRPASAPSESFLVAAFARERAAVLRPWKEEVRHSVTLFSVVAVAASVGLVLHQRKRAALARIEAEREAERRREEESRAAVQAQLAQSQKLESIGRLAGGVAHDFNNLLTAILSLGEEARESVRAGRVPDVEGLDEVLAAAHRAADLTRQLLAFARKQPVAPVILDLNAQLRSSEKLLRRVLGEDVRLVVEPADGLWSVLGDPGLLGQVVLNLAVNARDAMPRGGTLTVSTRNVTLGEGDARPDPTMLPGDYVRLSVADTGTGMSPDVLARVFEPFFTTKNLGKGTGLGLATVHGIVRQSGAFLAVRSTPGDGSVFEVWFPRKDGEAAPAPSPPRGSGGDETILVVEDDPAVRSAVVNALRAGGYEVLAASGGEEAVALARACLGGIDLLVTDVVMPGAHGPDVAVQMAETVPGVAVLFISGYAPEGIESAGRAAGDLDFLQKPFTPDALRTRVREILDRRKRVLG